MTFFRSYAELLKETRFLSPPEEAIASIISCNGSSVRLSYLQKTLFPPSSSFLLLPPLSSSCLLPPASCLKSVRLINLRKIVKCDRETEALTWRSLPHLLAFLTNFPILILSQ